MDCVRFASLGLIDSPPELIVSGINHGANLGDDITYSGTVAAALEGIMLGIPALAVSLAGGRDFEPLAKFVARIVDELDDVPMPEGTLLNVEGPRRRREGRVRLPARQARLQRQDGAHRGGGAAAAATGSTARSPATSTRTARTSRPSPRA